MEAKIKAAVPPNIRSKISRQVAVLPLPSRSKTRISSGHRQTLTISRHSKRKSSTSLQSPGSPSDALSGISIAPCSSTTSSCLETVPGQNKVINPLEILQRCNESEFYKVTEINLHGEELTEIGDLEKFRKLRILDLSCNHISVINHLDFNKDLRELKLYDNNIRTIENLHNLKELHSLQLQHNNMKSIGRGLKELRKLQLLRLDCNKITRIETSDILPLVQLTSLNISSNQLDDLAALNYLPNLEELWASGNHLVTISSLQGCKKLTELDLSGNRLVDVSGIAGLPHLQILDVSANQLTSWKSLVKLKSLEELNANRNELTSLSELADICPQLQILGVADNSISAWQEVESLCHLPDLAELALMGNPFSSEDGGHFHYLQKIQTILPNIEIVDGANFKKIPFQPTGTPLMRPLTSTGVVSLRQMESQMKKALSDMEVFESSMIEKFDKLWSHFEELPAESPRSKVTETIENSSRISSRSSCRSKIQDAQQFAAQYLE